MSDQPTTQPTTADDDPLSDLDGRPVLLFDGVCNLCNRSVQEIIPRDPTGKVAFAPLQSEIGRALQERHGFDTDDLDTVILVEGNSVHTKSDAAIRVAELLGWPYAALVLTRLVPRSVRNDIYDFVADNRYDWFGRKDQCMVPDEDVSDRFLE